MAEDRKPPYKWKMQWDATRQGVWIGFGVDLNPACGQSEYIGVTGIPQAVDCLKSSAATSWNGQPADEQVGRLIMHQRARSSCRCAP